MKSTILTLGLLVASLSFSNAADKKHDHDHDHDHKHEAEVGPTGGRILHEVDPHAEFFVNKDKKIEIRFLNDKDKVVAPTTQVVTVTTGTRKKPVKLTFVKDGEKLVSEQTIPDGNNNPTVVQIRSNAEAKAVTEKFNLNLDKCPTSGHPEYALGDHSHDHDHKH
ncbi:hypothetical protein FEM03_23420 [Phragmitibacter flavus]|uniref:DUF2796 domain-containing protein n=1 Tax=Phragmitibacter flavus TaxID=2576071 RepID=A0A5R8K7E6_9BACT|nr:hypothetical protein [Phragmitibacter flavus]TLD68273.1 hypothetical protein FEM03_23420 [Phragmitibacter flavus]